MFFHYRFPLCERTQWTWTHKHRASMTLRFAFIGLGAGWPPGSGIQRKDCIHMASPAEFAGESCLLNKRKSCRPMGTAVFNQVNGEQ
jgi:hypothetical protein